MTTSWAMRHHRSIANVGNDIEREREIQT